MAEQAVNFTTISPDPGESVTSFYKKAGYGSLDEFVAAPINKGKIRFDKDNVPYVLAGVDYHVVQKEEPGIVPANNNISDEDLLIEKALEQKEQPVEDYSQGKFTAPGIDVSLEGGGDLDTTERDFTRGIVTETDYGTSKVDITNINQDVPSSEASQFAEGGVTEGGVALAPKPEVVEVKPVITGDEVAAIPEGSPATTVSATNLDKVEPPGKDIPPTESELKILIDSLKPMSTGGKEVYEGVITALKGIEFGNTDDAKELYQQLSEDAERETKKIDDSIAEIAKEEIKPTFTGFNKFLAVLGAAMGAYGSSMTGMPNYALQIINKAIDADQEQFLASKEIRTKSLLEQRKAVLQRRSDLLQLGLNEADKMLKVAQNQQDKQIQIANVQGIIDGIENLAIENKNAQTLTLIEVLSKKAAATLLRETAQTKDQRERGVKGIELTDENGNLKVYGAYLTATPKEGPEHRKSWSETKAISKILDEIDKIAGTAGAFAPASLSNTRTSLENQSSQLIVHLKELYGMGAHFTVFEQALVRQQTPTDALFEQFKVWEQKSKDLRKQLIMKHEARVGSQGGILAQMPNAAGKKKLGPGMKTGVSK